MIRCRFVLSGTAPADRRLYRTLRRHGMSRRAAHLFLLGVYLRDADYDMLVAGRAVRVKLERTDL